jgi:uncharacterized protein (DUF1501 family)
MTSRRVFLKNGGLVLACASGLPEILARALDVRPSRQPRVLIAIFLRGGADGLNMIVPFGDPHYYAARPTIAIAPPGAGPGAAVDLDGFFGLHPRLAPLRALQHAQLAVVHACGSPDIMRSHLDAQHHAETAVPGAARTEDGWLNRYLQATGHRSTIPCRAVACGSVLPRSLEGSAQALAVGELESPVVAQYPRSPIGRSLETIARLVKTGAGVEVACLDSGDWDHHAHEGGANGQLADRLDELARGVRALSTDLAERMREIVIVVMSEFGRSVSENGDRGTDHGHGSVMLVVGGSVRGGVVQDRWPGLSADRLCEGGLAVTTDFRAVLQEVLQSHFGLPDTTAVFPGFIGAPRLGLFRPERSAEKPR